MVQALPVKREQSLSETNYLVTVLRYTAAQQSCVVTGEKLLRDKEVLCRAINAVNRFPTTTLCLRCPPVSAEARVAVMDELPVSGADFLLGNDLVGGREWNRESGRDWSPGWGGSWRCDAAQV